MALRPRGYSQCPASLFAGGLALQGVLRSMCSAGTRGKDRKAVPILQDRETEVSPKVSFPVSGAATADLRPPFPQPYQASRGLDITSKARRVERFSPPGPGVRLYRRDSWVGFRVRASGSF